MTTTTGARSPAKKSAIEQQAAQTVQAMSRDRQLPGVPRKAGIAAYRARPARLERAAVERLGCHRHALPRVHHGTEHAIARQVYDANPQRYDQLAARLLAGDTKGMT